MQPFHVQPKPELKEEHKEAREEFCTSHLQSAWSVWIWSDEFTIYPNGKRGLFLCCVAVAHALCHTPLLSLTLHNTRAGLIYWARHKGEVPHVGTKKFPKSFQFFAAFSRDGVLRLRDVHGKLNSTSFTQILDHVFKELHQLRHGLQCVLMHDNAPYWTSRCADRFVCSRVRLELTIFLLERLKTSSLTIRWSNRSSFSRSRPGNGLRIVPTSIRLRTSWCVCVFVVRVSRVWLLLQAIVKRRVNKRLAKLDLAVPRTPELYLQYLKEEWGRTPEKTLRNLVDSMPKRCASCIARHGEITDY